MGLKEFVFSVVIPIVISGITGCISGILTYRKEIKKAIYEEKQKLYIDIISLLEQLQYKPQLIYDYEQFIQPLRQIRAKTNFYASRDVLEVLIPFNDRIMTLWHRYTDLFNSERALEELYNRQEYEKEIDGTSPEQVEWEFQQQEGSYIEANLISKDEIIVFLNNLSMTIRSELKTE